MTILNAIVEPNRTTRHTTTWSTTRKQWPNGRITVKRNWAAPLNTFEVEWDGLSLTELNALRDFFNSMSGGYGTFDFIDRHTDTTYTVRFADDDFERRMVRNNSRGVYKVKLKLEEVKS